MIYFIINANTKAVKIGTSRDPAKRIAALQTAVADPLEIIGLIPGGPSLERRLHNRFADLRIRGEWFRGEPDFIDAIGTIVHVVENNQTVWEATMERGGDIVGLSGLYVSLLREDIPSQLVDVSVVMDGDMLLQLDDGRQVYASKTYLLSPWLKEFEFSACNPQSLNWKNNPVVTLTAYTRPSSMTEEEFASILSEALQFIGRRICSARKNNNENGEVWIECNPLSDVPQVNCCRTPMTHERTA